MEITIYIGTECDRGLKLGRFSNDQSREDIRKIIASDLEKFRINNSLTLNSLSLYFRNLNKKHKEICIFKDFNTWQTKKMTHVEKTKYSKRKHTSSEVAKETGNSNKPGNTIIPLITNVSSIPVISFKQHRIYNIQPVMASGLRSAQASANSSKASTPKEMVKQSNSGDSVAAAPTASPNITISENSPSDNKTSPPTSKDSEPTAKENLPKEPAFTKDSEATKEVTENVEDKEKSTEEPSEDTNKKTS